MNYQEERHCGDCTKCKVGLKVGNSPTYCVVNYGTEYQLVIRLTNDDDTNPKGIFFNNMYDEEVRKVLDSIGTVEKVKMASI